MDSKPVRLVWIDLEMTGLDPETCVIVEMGMLITGPDLQPIEQVEWAVWQPDEVLARMDPFVREMHTKSGLIDRIRDSKKGQRDVERDALSFLSKHAGYREGILAGNSIHTDRRFLCRHMPLFEAYLHYRQVDVSSLKVLAQAWAPQVVFGKTDKSHTAISDILGSLAELRHYRDQLFRLAAPIDASPADAGMAREP